MGLFLGGGGGQLLVQGMFWVVMEALAKQMFWVFIIAPFIMPDTLTVECWGLHLEIWLSYIIPSFLQY